MRSVILVEDNTPYKDYEDNYRRHCSPGYNGCQCCIANQEMFVEDLKPSRKPCSIQEISRFATVDAMWSNVSGLYLDYQERDICHENIFFSPIEPLFLGLPRLVENENQRD